MNNLIMIILSIIVIVNISCGKEKPNDDCKGFSSSTYKHGYAFANGSYKNFGDYAIFVRERVTDSLSGQWKHDKLEKSIELTKIDDCAEVLRMSFTNITIIQEDTIPIKYSYLGIGTEFPTAELVYLDADAILDQYDVVDGDNWLIIESINRDTTEITGKFQISFSSVLINEKKDDPNRPDTLAFTEGEFRAKFLNF